MTGLAIVAIPSPDDYVWKISSEKVPHLTLCFLGDQSKNPNVGQMAEFLGHVAKTSMRRFGLDVDRRGTLGDQDADVLFFKNPGFNVKNLEMVRHYLLTNQHIARAYNSTEQYPEWTPHLTLGYPNTPAKKDDRDYPGITWVNFDRVALWTGDYEGPEFELKDDFSQEMAMGDIPMSALSHFGVKGMKWGVHTKDGRQVRLDPVAGAAVNAVRKRRAPDKTKKEFSKKVGEAGGLHKAGDKDLDAMIKRMELERKFSKFMTEEADRRREGRKAALKLLGEVGKIAVPIAIGIVAGRMANNRGGNFRTSATVSRTVIDGISKSTDLVRR